MGRGGRARLELHVVVLRIDELGDDLDDGLLAGLGDDLRGGEEVGVAALREHVEDHREIRIAEEGIEAEELVVGASALAGNVVALGGEVAVAVAVVGGAAEGVYADLLPAPARVGGLAERALVLALVDQITHLRGVETLPGGGGLAGLDGGGDGVDGAVGVVGIALGGRTGGRGGNEVGIPQTERLADVATEAEGVVVVEDPLEAEGVEVLLRDLDEAGLDFDQLGLAAELVEHLLELGEVLAGVAHVELAERLDVLDGGAFWPLDAHLLEERLPVLVGRRLGVLVLAGAAAGAEAVAHGLDLVGRGGNTLDERLGHVVLAREDLGGGHVLVHHHDDGVADDELVVDRIADELQRLVEGDVVGGDGGDGGEAVGVLGGLVLVAGGGEVVGLFAGGVGGGSQLLARTEEEVEAAALGREGCRSPSTPG